MKILGFIPARGGSKGVPDKNIKLLAGKPLIAYTIEQALASRINKVLVSTDSKKIKEIAVKFDAEVPFLRPAEHAKDESTIEAALKDTLNRLKILEDYEPEIIVLLQPTSPLRKAEHIDESIDIMIKENADTYDRLYGLYRKLHDIFGTRDYAENQFDIMKTLLAIRDEVRGKK